MILWYHDNIPAGRSKLPRRWSFEYAQNRLDPFIGPSGHLVVNNYGKLGIAFAETDVAGADLETTINDLMSGQHNNPVRVVALDRTGN